MSISENINLKNDTKEKNQNGGNEGFLHVRKSESKSPEKRHSLFFNSNNSPNKADDFNNYSYEQRKESKPNKKKQNGAVI